MRIIAGSFKGRNILPPPAGSAVRPITASVKKSLFDILAPVLPDAVVLDLYCGTGTIGLEAMSRGAARCVFVERDPAVVSRLRRNIEALGVADRTTIWRCNVDRQLAKMMTNLQSPVDLAFVDPPYPLAGRWDWDQAEKRVFLPIAGKLTEQGLVVLRAPGRLRVPELLAGLKLERTKDYRDMVVRMFAREKTCQAVDDLSRDK